MSNKEIKKAKKVLEEISQDGKERYLAELREKYIMDQKAIEDAGYDKGLNEGISQGQKKKTLEIAKKMKEQGIDIETIKDITDLTIEEITKL
jgi:predicted transposase/invertase (TIGR01784 family)